MKTLSVGSLTASRIAYGCMPLGGGWGGEPIGVSERTKAMAALRAAIDAGVDFFDHADIYCRGKSETVFAAAIAEIGAKREDLVIQSKCGIRFAGDPDAEATGRYDFSREHIVASCEGSLRRLGTTYLDVYLLHRPDALVEPEEVARAFDDLASAGKVRQFGVSNHSPLQIELLRRHVRQPLVVNQLQLSLVHAHLIDAGIVANQATPALGADGTIDYCRLHGIAIQAWSPLGRGQAMGAVGAGASARDIELARVVGMLAARKGVPAEAIAVAWLLRHPAGIQPIVGSTDPVRIRAACAGDGVELSREEWYALHVAARGKGMP